MPKYHTATGLVFNEKNKILLIKHKRHGVWMPPGGQLEEGELPHEAMLREVLEETGLNVEIISLKQGIASPYSIELPRPFVVNLVDSKHEGNFDLLDYMYLCRAFGNEMLRPSAEETDAIGWFCREQFQNMETFEDVAQIVAAAFEFMENFDT